MVAKIAKTRVIENETGISPEIFRRVGLSFSSTYQRNAPFSSKRKTFESEAQQ
jgi:hypothetical protein